MRNWVPAVKNFTPSTWFIASPGEAHADMFPCHVKDGVKSANATHLPRPCLNQADVTLHKEELNRQRGNLDDGLVLRAHVDAWPDETRVWVMGPTVKDVHYVNAYDALETKLFTGWLEQVFSNAPAHFFDAPFTMDVAKKKSSGDYFVMDIGDAGVSDYKEGNQDVRFLDTLRQRWIEVLSGPTYTHNALHGTSMP